MRRKIPAVYVFNANERTLKEYFNMIWDRIEFSSNFDGPKNHMYAVNYGKKIRIEIAKRSGDIFYNSQHNEYVVYLNEPDRKKACDILFNHMLSKLSIEICYHERELEKVRDDYFELQKLQESLNPIVE